MLSDYSLETMSQGLCRRCGLVCITINLEYTLKLIAVSSDNGGKSVTFTSQYMQQISSNKYPLMNENKYFSNIGHGNGTTLPAWITRNANKQQQSDTQQMITQQLPPSQTLQQPPL